MIGRGVRDGQSRLLEYEKASPPRTPLAGPSMFRTTLRNRKQSRRVPRHVNRRFALMLDLNRPAQPRMSGLPLWCREASPRPSPNPPPSSAMPLSSQMDIQGRSDKPGDGRLRSRLSAKLLSACRRRRRPHPSASKRPAGTWSGQPRASAAATPAPIRASASGRHEHRNRSYSSASIAPPTPIQ